MSVAAISAVFQHSRSTGNTRNVLVVLADRADDLGLSWPGVADTAKRANCSERTVQYALRELEALDELEVQASPRGGRNITPLYRIKLPGLEGQIPKDHPYLEKHKGAILAPFKRAQNQAVKGARSRTKRVQTSAPEPSVDPPIEPIGSPLTPQGGESSPAVLRALEGSRRRRDIEALRAFDAEHFPGIRPGAVANARWRLEKAGRKPTIEALRDFLRISI